MSLVGDDDPVNYTFFEYTFSSFFRLGRWFDFGLRPGAFSRISSFIYTPNIFMPISSKLSSY